MEPISLRIDLDHAQELNNATDVTDFIMRCRDFIQL